MKKIEVVLFDLDGTIIDSKPGITKSVQYALAKLDIIENNLAKLERFIGPPLAESFSKYYHLNTETIMDAIKYFREYYTEKGIFDNCVYSGIPELLKGLQEQDKKLVIATAKPTVFSKKILEYYDLDKFFSLIVGSNLDGTRISKPEVIAYIIESLENINRDTIIMVGDREHDVLGARQNGIASIAVAYGYGIAEELLQIQPDYFVNSVEELAELLKKL